jgi:hypothetical protein
VDLPPPAALGKQGASASPMVWNPFSPVSLSPACLSESYLLNNGPTTLEYIMCEWVMTWVLRKLKGVSEGG